MRRYKSQRIQKALMALSGAALASTMMFSNAQAISSDNFLSKNNNKISTNKMISQFHKVKKAERQIQKKRKNKIKKEESL